MKNFMLFGLVLLALTSCEINVIEPNYDARSYVVGDFVMDEYSETYNDYYTYSLSISKSRYASTQIYLNNFYDLGISVIAYIDYNKIDIPYQVIDGYEIEGVGTVSGDLISFSYRVRDKYKNTGSDFCKTTAKRAF